MVDYLSPNWQRSALLTIDLQRDFLDDGVAPIPGTTAIVENVGRLAEAFRTARRPIVHVIRLYEPGGSDVDLVRRDAVESGARLVVPGSDGSQIPEPVVPPGTVLDAERLAVGRVQVLAEREVILFKPRWSAFHRTALEEWLRKEGCDTVVVAGCNLPNCPRATLFDATERDLRAVLIPDAVSQGSAERLADLERIGVRLFATSEAVAHLGAV
jgi:nicotinamidase-related amidase